ncbi:antiterminator LoaP [Paenibacillus apiarius]|uniref:Antiterminator LoaP n=1 Tax=Paenibacillus apiarius TaxID=46240 RepID=A0ABT4DUT5_9BACL|nr:antiterminator LoaP [Paenibacillus apiarius]MCY9517587.1 antiterminator LoaP [Paenibacillus apiarius]MCY9519766.1 antiterminator LoaP [Paenibacillus apiarius]MCY9555032.1 antiterminator LoaP [Paenibacillus apiarius]MCY9559349.1 antiterminator LoaP [Paenibacillus apiarius]MCY9682708.1 antiterminator LoaP [Paenibacillus apiarius]
MKWYVLFVETGKEDMVREMLSNRFDKDKLHCIVPKRRVSERHKGLNYDTTKLLFPGYILINTEMNFETYYKIKAIPKVYCLLNYRNNKYDELKNYYSIKFYKDSNVEEQYFKELKKEDISLILNLINGDGVIDYSEVFTVNSKVFVKSGPLVGNEAIIKKLDKRKGRAKILLNFFDTSKLVDVGVIMLKHLST